MKGDTVIAETGAPITFYSNLSYDVDGEIISYNWTFMPGLSGSTQKSPVKAFPKMGEYSARLIIRDDDGDEGVTSVRISITNRPPVAVIAGPKEAVVGEQVQFIGSDSHDQDSGGDIRTHRWSMGDGTIYTEPNPNHTYRIASNFTVELRVEDKHGGVDITTWKISVTEEPKEEEDEGLMAADYTALGMFVVVLVICIIAQSAMGTRPRRPPRTRKGKKKSKKKRKTL
jgi:PKD repeat protein